MTKNKSLKRKVRARMFKTGERYTAARRQLLARSDVAETFETPPERTAPPARPTAAPDRRPAAPAEQAAPASGRGPSDTTLAERTGHPWPYWRTALAAWGAANQPHPKIVRWLMDEQGVDGWWAQSLTVRYEREIGRRVVGQRSGGIFAVSATRTIEASPLRVFEAIADPPARSRWLPDGELTLHVRRSTPPRHVRFDVGEGPERLTIGVDSKGEGRCAVYVEHERLRDAAHVERMRGFWRERLAELKLLLEA